MKSTVGRRIGRGAYLLAVLTGAAISVVCAVLSVLAAVTRVDRTDLAEPIDIVDEQIRLILSGMSSRADDGDGRVTS